MKRIPGSVELYKRLEICEGAGGGSGASYVTRVCVAETTLGVNCPNTGTQKGVQIE